MSNPEFDSKQLQTLAISLISLAKSDFDNDTFKKLDIPNVQRFCLLISECVPFEYIADQTLLRHANEKLVQGYSVEETVMHVFMLYIYRLVSEGSSHPLERGIVRQKIIGILPIFESGVNKGLIKPEIYDPNADALSHIADHTGEVPELIEALSHEYLRLRQQ